MAHITPMGLAPTLVVIDGQPTTTSNDIAKHFGKRHDNVLQSIAATVSQCTDKFAALNFQVSEFIDSTGRKLPNYRVTRKGFALLGMGFTGKRAFTFKVAYLEAFDKMEAALRGATAHKAPAPVPVLTAPAAPLTLRDKQLTEFTRLFDQLTPTNRKLWLSHTSGFVWGCASTSPTEMAYLA